MSLRLYERPMLGLRGTRRSAFDEMESILDTFRNGWDSPLNRSNSRVPSCNVEKFKDKTIIELATPGMSKEDIKISLTDDYITIEGEQRKETKSEGERIHTEYSVSKFSRSFSIPENIDLDKIEGDIENGILRITLPYQAPQEPRKIPIKSLS